MRSIMTLEMEMSGKIGIVCTSASEVFSWYNLDLPGRKNSKRILEHIAILQRIGKSFLEININCVKLMRIVL